MATDTRIRITRNPYSGFEVWIWGNGELTRRSFNNGHELTTVLAGERVDDRTLEEACDMFEALEWEQTYPLGVVYVGEAATDSPVDPPTFGPFAPRRNYVAEVNAKFYPWTVAFLTLAVAWLYWRGR